jgi:hypothetical protein
MQARLNLQISDQQEVPMRLSLKPCIAGTFAALLFGASALATPAYAAPVKLWEEYDDDDGTVVVMYYDSECDCKWAMIFDKDGGMTVYHFVDGNPEDTASGRGSHADAPDVVRLIKLGAITYKVRIAPADSAELLGHLKGGGGLGPRYNPSDDDNGSGHGDAPTHSMEVKKTQAEINEEIAVANEVVAELAAIGTAMGDGEEGGSESANGPNKNGNGSGKGPGDDQGDYTEGQDKDIGKTEKDLLGAKPDVVNPPHWERTGAGGSDHASSAGGGSSHNSLGGGAHNATSTHG